MVNYICRTCLYVSDDEFLFRKLEKVKSVLETFVPEVKNCIGKYTLICEQCYYFLKNVEKFKAKCIETQKKFCSINEGTMINKNDSVLQNVTDKELHVSDDELDLHKKRPHVDNENSTKTESKKKKQDFTASLGKQAVSHFNAAENSVKSPSHNSSHYLSKSQTTEKKPNNLIHSSVSDELLQLFNHHKDSDENCNNKSNVSIREVTLNNDCVINLDSDSSSVDNDDSDEYMTRNDLVAAGILSDNDRGSFGGEKVSSHNDCPEIEDDRNNTGGNALNRSDNTCRDSKSKKRKSCNTNSENNAIIKLEKFDDENPGFFNKQSVDGFYKCRLCTKHYKRSKGLYKHTKDKHEDQIKIYHCKYCSFFTIWKSALSKHYSAFHEVLSTAENSESMFICYHCSFESRSKFHLSRHIQEIHSFQKIPCSLCRKKFSNSKLFAEHVKKEHANVTPSPTCCPECCLLFITESNYKKHIKEKHENGSENVLRVLHD